MAPTLSVIALISGGKDSLYTILHCFQNGNPVVALANLHPHTVPTEGEGVDDLNSLMFQTVGHDAIPLYEDALEIPLHRRATRGIAVRTEESYDVNLPTGNKLDETEDIFELLQRIKKKHPNANAVCSGAVLSSYQRTRVESVALRLGLTPLAYLWQYPILPRPVGRAESATGLLADMKEAGCDARLIKIATGGGEDLELGTDVTNKQIQDDLIRSLCRYHDGDDHGLRGAVLGEGGEYETIALDGPAPVWKKSLRFDDMATGTMRERSDSQARYAVLGKGTTFAKANTSYLTSHINLVPEPAALDKAFAAIGNQLKSLAGSSPGLDTLQACPISYTERLNPTCTCVISDCHFSIANIMNDKPMTAADQFYGHIVRLKQMLHRTSVRHSISPPLSTADISSVTLVLSKMSDFDQINKAYVSMFEQNGLNPPARVTIATHLPEGVLVSLSVYISGVFEATRKARLGLHIQSQSYWAPANIGPYSQAITTPAQLAFEDPNDDCSVVHVSGQIPLVPHTMVLLDEPFLNQAILSLQHLWRVAQNRHVDIWPWAVAFVSRTSDAPNKGLIVARVWHKLFNPVVEPPADDVSDDENFDVYDLQKTLPRSFRKGPLPAFDQHLHLLPNQSLLKVKSGKSATPPIIVPEVSELPRGASVEWWSTGIAGLSSKDSKVGCEFATKSWPWGTISTMELAPNSQEDVKLGKPRPTKAAFRALLVSLDDGEPSADIISTLRAQLVPGNNNCHGIIHGTAFAAIGQGLALYERLAEAINLEGIAVIPTHSLHGTAFDGGDDVEMKPFSLALLLRVDTTVVKAGAPFILARGDEKHFSAQEPDRDLQ